MISAPAPAPVALSLAVTALLASALAASAAFAQQAQAPPDDTLRLFQRFVEDGAITPHVWLEGQGRMQTNSKFFNDDEGDIWTGTAILGLGLTEDLEVGISVGLVQMDPDNSDSENGLSDINVHGKYRLDELPLSVVVGGLVKIPTADEGDGVGTGGLDAEAFVAVRKDLGHVNIIGNAGLRLNGDADPPAGAQIDGKMSLLLGGGVIIGLTTRLYNSWELTFESRRFEAQDSDTRLTPGLIWKVGERGLIRAAVGLGLSDGAPTFEGIGGIVLSY